MTRLEAPAAVNPGMTIDTSSAQMTQEFAAALAQVAQAGDRLALIGTLGAGKTQFAKGFAVGLGIDDVVNSPSFTLMSEYVGRLRLFHQDLYRLAGTDEALGGGLLDERQDAGVTLTEWAERLDDALDPVRVTVSIEPTGETVRRIALLGSGAAFERYLAAARTWSPTGSWR
jgi:tRNA threonylcarbamoyladenosine biosynthesis protein TsaE